MGHIEEIEDNDDLKEVNGTEKSFCSVCKKICESKCTACRKVYYCSKKCQKYNWKKHKFQCEILPFKICQSPELGRYLEASRDLDEGEIIVSEAPLVFGPVPQTRPLCLSCYKLVDGSYLCHRSGWPVCDSECEKNIVHHAEVVVPHQTGAKFEIDDYDENCYLYECITPLRALMLQKSCNKKYKKILQMQSHLKERKKNASWNSTNENVIGVMKKTLGIMVFEALFPQMDFSDETIENIVGIFATNAIEIRLPESELTALYEIACILEHNCTPNVKFNFDSSHKITVKAARKILKGEHLSTMYTHSLWGTAARRDHLMKEKYFWCKCQRCEDPTELGTHFSTLIRNGQNVLPNASFDIWTNNDGSIKIGPDAVRAEMTKIGQELAILHLKGSISDFGNFLEKYKSSLHPNHYYMITAKHTMMQMLGRSEGSLIQDMPVPELKHKEQLCREVIHVCERLDPCMARLEIYVASALYELHLPLLQYGKRLWEKSEMPTESFRKSLFEPRNLLKKAYDIIKDENNVKLQEGQ